MLLRMQNLECDLRIDVFVDGKAYAAKGRYAEQALPNARPNAFFRSVYRLDIDFSLALPSANAMEPNRMILVCHTSDHGTGHQVDRYTHIEGNRYSSTVDLNRLADRLLSTNREVFFTQVSEVRNLGAMAGMMRQMYRFYEFTHLRREDLQHEETIPAVKLTGTLRNIYYRELLSKFGGLSDQGDYPPGFPSDVEVWIGMHDYFPYKIRYLRKTSSQHSEQIQTAPKELLFQEAFFNVVINGPTLPDFRFAPLNLPEGVFRPEDETDRVIQMLGL